MALWGNVDQVADAPKGVVNNNNETGTALYGTKVYAVDANEQSIARTNGNPRGAHAGWVLKTEGTGGRAGRVSYETLVAMGSVSGTNVADDADFPDA